jgi:hypothetical protein
MAKPTPPPPAAEPPRDPHAALKARIGRAHRRLREARNAQESPQVIAALTREVDRSLEELQQRLMNDHFENLYRNKE